MLTACFIRLFTDSDLLISTLSVLDVVPLTCAYGSRELCAIGHEHSNDKKQQVSNFGAHDAHMTMSMALIFILKTYHVHVDIPCNKQMDGVNDVPK